MGNREWTHKWRLHWFECLNCGHRSFTSVTKTSLAPNARRLSTQYWCAQCDHRSVLRRPHLNTFIWFGVFGPAIVVLFFWGTPVLGWLPSIGIALLLCLLASLLTYVTNAYVPTKSVEP